MEADVFKFLNKHYVPSAKILLALSGGPDSLALLHLLLNYRKRYPLKFGVAHIDHGWRQESHHEAQVLKEMVRTLAIPFHLKRLDPVLLKGNLEDSCRKERLCFYKELCLEMDYKAIMLAHHADDQSETVLKRVFEGGSLPHLCGLRDVNEVEGVILWRPLLQTKKRQILEWLEKHDLKGFEDRTNLDPKFLRGRFRTTLIPHLVREFGKEIGASLERIGSQAGELFDYLDSVVFPYVSRIEKGPRGLYLDLSREAPKHSFELKHLIRKLCEQNKLCLPHSCLDTVARLIQVCAADRQIQISNHVLYVDRRRLFLVNQDRERNEEHLHLRPGFHRYGSWTVEVSHPDPCESTSINGWLDVWRGQCEAWLPEGNYRLGPVSPNVCYPGGSPIAKWWTNAKVPAFMRSLAPAVWSAEGEVVHEFLTGKKRKGSAPDRGLIRVRLQYQSSNINIPVE